MEERLFDVIQIGKGKDVASRVFDVIISILIVTSCVLAIASTFEAVQEYMPLLHVLELVITGCFIVELLLRLWTAKFLYGKNRAASAIRYIFSFYGIVELLTILSVLLPLIFPAGFVLFRIVRVIRIFRLFRLSSRIDAFTAIFAVLHNKRSKLASSLIMLIILMLAASLIMYHFEHDVQPDEFSNVFSGFWWATSTIFTIGYGDIYPVTVGGQVMSIVITFIGVGIIAIPTGILAAGFTEYADENRSKKKYCPNCGSKIR